MTITAIVTCKGRLGHLKETAPLLVRAGFDQIVVVDYDCPQGAADWARVALPAATVVRVEAKPAFNVSDARNLGAAAATGTWLFFVDADVRTPPGFAAHARERIRPGEYGLPDPRPVELYGTMLVARADFEALGGFDTVFEGWGGEDVDLIDRLEGLGRRARTLDGRHLGVIEHGDDLRVQHYALKNRALSGRINGLYRTIKQDLARLGASLDTPARERLYASVRNAMTRQPAPGSIDVTFREAKVFGSMRASATLRYQLSDGQPA